MNQDSVWAFRTPSGSVVHTVDSRLASRQLDEILAFLGGPPDVVLVQCAGASWYPLVYRSYDAARIRALGERKREHKLAYALSVLEHLRPQVGVLTAGPPAFLDPELRYANSDPSFPTPDDAREWLRLAGYRGRLEVPLPGDRLTLPVAALYEDTAAHASFAWADRETYVASYAERMAHTVCAVRAEADAIAVPDLRTAFEAHLRAMLGRSVYFNERIGMTVGFDVAGPSGFRLCADIGPEPAVRQWKASVVCAYEYRFHARWLKRILVDEVPWEDFFLSLRFEARRDPDVYNDHLLGLMKFNDGPALRAVERYERTTSPETILVEGGDGTRYEVARYCPHGGAEMAEGRVEGHTITCLRHHYVFDLRTGRCATGNCRLRTRRVSGPDEASG